MATPETTPSRQLVCLCAAWCGTCNDYRPVFDAVAARHPGLAVRWIDIEDESDLVGELDIETFPTVLIIDGAGSRASVRFFGPLLPHAQTLDRLLDSLEPGGPAPGGLSGDVLELAAQLA